MTSARSHSACVCVCVCNVVCLCVMFISPSCVMETASHCKVKGIASATVWNPQPVSLLVTPCALSMEAVLLGTHSMPGGCGEGMLAPLHD